MSWPTKAEWQSKYEHKAKNPGVWRDHAVEMREAARVLWSHIETAPDTGEKSRRLFAVGHTAMMLEGLAVEILAKAVLVKKEPGVVANGEWTYREHKLLKIFERLGLQLHSDKERDLSARLTAFVEWAGRYPIPLGFEQLLPKITAHTYEIPPGQYYSTEDRERVDALYRRLEVVLEGEPNSAGVRIVTDAPDDIRPAGCCDRRGEEPG